MKKLYRKGTIHPSPPVISDQLSFLPAAVLTLTTALSPEEREVLAYLISCSNNSNNNASSSSSSSFQGHQKSAQQQKNGGVSFAKSKSTGNNNINDHPPFFTCNCFRCYMSYWVKWDASPNRQLIHEIIDAFEDHEMLDSTNKKVKNNKKDKKKRSNIGNDHQKNDHHHHQLKDQQILAAESESVEGNYRKDDGDNDIHEGCNNNKGEEGEEKGSVRSFVSYIGERIWGVWG